MKIGIYFETSSVAGGAQHQNLRLLDIFEKNFSKSYEFVYIVTNKNLKNQILKRNIKCIHLKKNFITRIEQFLLRFDFIKEIYKKLKIFSRLEKFLKNQNFDLIFFNAPYEISLAIRDTHFVMMLLSMQHKTLSFFPEYRGGHDYETRDYILKNAVNKSFKVFVGTVKDKDELINYYNAPKEKIVIQPYAANLPNVYEKNKKLDYTKIFNQFNLPKNKDIFIYPAQFWAHKNHRYIVDVALELKKNKIYEIFFIFCGSDKGNLNYIKKLISDNELQDYFKIFNYINDEKLIALYLNCYGVFMPTLVGHSTIPMYEAFFFKKNILYTQNLADEKLKKFISEIDISDVKSFYKKYQQIKKDKNNLINLDNANLYYLNNCSESEIVKNFEEVFEEFKFLKQIWSDQID